MISLLQVVSCDDVPLKKTIYNKPVTIFVQPFNGIDSNDIVYVVTGLKKVYPHIFVKQSIPLPSNAFNSNRGRYRADSLIRILNSKANNNEVVIGLTSRDISTTNNSIADWGVTGLDFVREKLV